MIRDACVAGQFYELDPGGLNSQIGGMVDPGAKREAALGVMSPHAGYMYSGRVAAMVFSRIEPVDTYVILGPNHTGAGPDFSIMKEGVWRLPSGEVRIDSNLAKDILVNSRQLSDDILAHQHEHSVEVQLPFIQYFNPELQFVPITIRHYPPTEDFLKVLGDIAAAIAAAVKGIHEKVMIVASSDLTHYESQEKAKINDKAAMDAILAMDEKRLFKEVDTKKISMCGYGPVAVMLMACKLLGAKKAENVGYMTSADATGDYGSVVGYGGIVVK